MIIHPSFWANGGALNGDISTGARAYDIALVRLDTPVTTRTPVAMNCDAKAKVNALNEFGWGYWYV